MTRTTPSDEDLPNGGWGWMVVLGAAIIYMFIQSLGSIFGLLFGDHLKSMGYGMIEASFVMNTNVVTLNCTGILAGQVLRVCSERLVSIVGCLMVSFGLIMSSFTTTVFQLIITYGIIVGVGLGLTLTSTFIILHSYFSSRRGQAIGIAMAGSGIGQMLMPTLVRLLLQHYGCRGSILILGGLTLHGVAGALLFQPVKWHTRKNGNTSILMVVNDTTIHNHNTKSNLCSKMCKSLEFDLLQSPVFCCICFGIALVYTVLTSFALLFPFFLQETARLSRYDTSICMTVLAASDVLSRLTLAMVTDKYPLSCRSIFHIGVVCLCCAIFVMSFIRAYTHLIIASLLLGYVRAATVINQNLVVAEYVTKQQLPGAIGLTMMIKAVVVLTIGQFLGWVRDYTKSYPTAMHAQNLCLLVTIVLWSSEDFRKQFRT